MLYIYQLKNTNNINFTYDCSKNTLGQFDGLANQFICSINNNLSITPNVMVINKQQIMGNNCYQCPENSKSQKHQLSLNKYLNNNEQYVDVQLPPDDQFLAAYINQSIHLVNISDYLMNNKAKTLKKNYGLNKYYYGEMNNGVPTGDGIIYEPNKILMNGYFQHGILNGQAHIIYISSNSEYKGMVKDGKFNGVGTMNDYNQNYRFEGQWKNSVPVTGIMVLSRDSNISKIDVIDFHSRLANIYYHDGRVYQGQINNNTLMPEGMGRVKFGKFDVKDYYEGQWKDGKYNGQGLSYWKNGQYYKGTYRDGIKNGVGKFKFLNGNQYDGQWFNGKQQGNGTLYDVNGFKLKQGNWKQGVCRNGTDRFHPQHQFLDKMNYHSDVNLHKSKDNYEDSNMNFGTDRPKQIGELVRPSKSLKIQSYYQSQITKNSQNYNFKKLALI